ncbi:MAG: glycosyltransferase family 4 protein [Proteobacteria bacterium]|nr:glycosyltransferase family 4 protein [Pseudomonadota bacterium]
MKILILNYEYPPLGGGAANATYYLLRELAHRDIEVDLITSSVGAYRVEKIDTKITGHFLDIGKRGNLHFQTQRELLVYAWKSFQYASKLIRAKKPDIVHAFFGIPSGYIAMQLGLPYIVSLRGSDVPFYNDRFELLDRYVFKNLSCKTWRGAEAVVANSTGLRSLALKSSSAQAIEVITNGVDTDKFRPGSDERQTGKITLVSVGRLIQRKGYEYLIDALKGAKEFELVLIGDGNIKETLSELATRLNVDVKLLGRLEREGVIDNLQKADIFVLPSLNEGMSNSVLEAMACGLPVITTNVGGCDELVSDGVNGFVVEKADSSALSEALNKYAEKRSLIGQHGKMSRKVAEAMSWREVSRQYLDLYHRIGC